MSSEPRTELAEQLRQLGVETVTAEYKGYADQGCIETLEFGPVQAPPAVAAAVEDLFYDVLGKMYGGWQNNEGAFGQFTWNVRGDRIDLVHNIRTESYETEEQQL